MSDESEPADGDADVSGPLNGIRVIEVAEWVMVPGAGGVLADWGADVIKVEHPTRGDAVRGLNPTATMWQRHIIHNANRGKRSIGLDLTAPRGRELLGRLVEDADVFLTNHLPQVRSRLGIDVADLREINPRLIYARGTGVGPRGDEADAGGYDAAQHWARSGIGTVFHHPQLDFPLSGNAQFGDVTSAAILAGGVAAAIAQRERTGRASVVDVSLLGVGAWTICQDIVVAESGEPASWLPTMAREDMLNPIANTYRTADGRFIVLMILQSDRHWPEFCALVEAAWLRVDPRFVDAAARCANAPQLVGEIDSIFAQHTLTEWRQMLAAASFVWAVHQTPEEVARDPQVIANDYIVPVLDAENSTAPPRLVATPVQFDEQSVRPRRAPEHTEDTEAILLEAGCTWDDILDLKEHGVVT